MDHPKETSEYSEGLWTEPLSAFQSFPTQRRYGKPMVFEEPKSADEPGSRCLVCVEGALG